ncbi:hypothetical protein A2382_00765 [Candidatus Woesebacteria bacterium RIFOXYB1_FULL_38_16]|uniref:Membrane protein 6-pyruvoyl-tetrahydropterin synthase-related domain-containing protein n=1 Tax=Candidatus Woesebacteria bacterium RIFOXYB1_FULL_38_16 TaxID=1802538 RepID=A0A1F8CSP7_9BACT|nr:MAG: hypothetical protein A2191_03470 [Candidatus Woesebacteria bacterium RIFOXYA1_FULL_38_9]OGM79302.1 MAG: hypothetical protein A2382_00765 [Candidatus Woesebacteria bacterium RIFOXYB1_FULL_38_16]
MKQVIRKLWANWQAIVIAVFILIPVIWFIGKGAVLINGVDTNFPLNPLAWTARRMYVWTNISNGGSDFSSSTAGIFFHLVQLIPYLAGLPLTYVQLISFVFWMGLIVTGAYLLSREVFKNSKLVQILFVCLYSFNVYLFNTWENVKVANLSLMAAIPFGLIVLIWLNEQRKVGWTLGISLFVGIVVSGTGINPAYFICYFFILGFFQIAILLTQFSFRKIVIGFQSYMLFVFIIVGLNLYWILPTLNFITKEISLSGDLGDIGFTNWVDSLSKNTSLFNVMRMQGAWDWYAIDDVSGLPLYIPYVVNYFYSLPFLIFSILLPGLSIIGLVVRRRRNKSTYYLTFLLMFVVGVFLGAGTHAPTGALFRLMIEYVPLFSLFRSPWYIFTPLMILGTAGLVCLLMYQLISERNKLIRFIGLIGVVVLVVGNCLYTYPLIQGKIFRPSKSDGFFVHFPNYVYETKDILREIEGSRVIGYPDDELERFSWGYVGIESILGLLGEVEALYSPLNLPNSAIAKSIKAYYLALKKGQIDSSLSIADLLGARFLFVKHDQGSISMPLPKGIMGDSKKKGEWEFVELSKESFKKIKPMTSLVMVEPFDKADQALIVREEGQLIVNEKDSVVRDSDLSEFVSSRVVVAKNKQVEDYLQFAKAKANLADRLVERNLSEVVYEITTTKKGDYQLMLEDYQLERFGLKDLGELKVEIDGVGYHLGLIKRKNDFLVFENISLSEGFHRLVITLDNPNLVSGGDFEGERQFRESTYGEGNMIFTILTNDENRYLEIFNLNKGDASAEFKINNFDPLGLYWVEYKYRQIYGNNGVVYIGQNTKSGTLLRTQVERLPNYPDWVKMNTYYEPVKSVGEMKVLLSSPFTSDPLGTRMYYDDLVVRRVFDNRLLLAKSENKLKEEFSEEHIEIKMLEKTPVYYKSEVKSDFGTSYVLLFSENYSPQWKIRLSDKNGKELEGVRTAHFSGNLYANAFYIEGAPHEYILEIYYQPQRLYWIGVVGVGCTIFAVSVGLLVLKKKK